MSNRNKANANQQHENASQTFRATETKFTPGPYTIQRLEDGVDDYFFIVTQSDQRYVASIQFWDDVSTDTERAWANARLLAKAPEMFQALKELLQFAANGTLKNPPIEFYATEYKANLLIAEVERDE
jgi:hypothetical protein